MVNFSADDIEKIAMSTAIGLMREAFQLLSAGKVVVPLRTVMETEGQNGLALFMPSYSPEWKLFGMKMVGLFPGNQFPMPAIQGKMMVMSATDGTPLAVLDTGAVTALRTGAASGLATDVLALPTASILAVFGTGAQAWTQAAGVIAARPIKKVLINGTSHEREVDFCSRLSKSYSIPCEPLGNLNNLSTADVICTATTSLHPLFTREVLKPGVHINAVGSFKPKMRELGVDIISSCKLIVDQREAALHEAGEVAIPIAEGLVTSDCIHAELGEVIAKKKQGRSSSKEITVFKSVGNAIQDLAVARYLLGR